MSEREPSSENYEQEPLTYEEEVDYLFNEIIEKIKSGHKVWFPRVENPDVIDFFKNKKYQGFVSLSEVGDRLFYAYKVDPGNLDLSPLCVTPRPVKFEEAENILLSYIDE